MGAHVFPFAPPAAERCLALAPVAQTIAARLGDQHTEVLSAAAQLLELDDTAFARRLDLMRDEAGGALVHELGAALKHAAADFDTARHAVFLARARLAAGRARYGGFDEH